jgi:hypothetical protein
MNRRLIAICLVALAGAAVAAPAVSGSDATKSGTATPRVTSVRDSPGYVPLVDPESTSVRLGRRPNAPKVKTPFTNGASSLEHLGYAVCRAFERGTRDSLMRLTVTMAEFRDIMWLEFPQSRRRRRRARPSAR